MHTLFRSASLRLRAVAPSHRSAGVIALAVAALAASAPSAHAQFSSLSLPTITEASAGSSGTTVSAAMSKSSVFSFGLSPYAPFQFNANIKSFPINVTARNSSTGATFSQASSIDSEKASFTANGILFAPEYAYSLPNKKTGIGIGGWYWLHDQKKSEDYSGNFDADLYDIHIKFFLTPKVGLEVGYLGQTNSSIPKQEGVNSYVSYAFGENNAAKKGSYGITTGIGFQNVKETSLNVAEPNDTGIADITFKFKDTTDLGAYASGAYYVIPHGSITLSYWLLTGSQKVDVGVTEAADPIFVSGSGSTSQSRTVSRVALGFGYQF